MREEHAADREGTKTEFVRGEDLARMAHSLATAPHAELGRDDQNVPGLLLGDLVERVERTRVLAQVLGRELAPVVIVNFAPAGELDHELDAPAVLLDRVLDLWEVSLSHGVDGRDGEEPIGIVWERDLWKRLLDVLGREAERQAKSAGQDVDLPADRLRPELRRVAVAGGDCLIARHGRFLSLAVRTSTEAAHLPLRSSLKTASLEPKFGDNKAVSNAPFY